MKLRKQKKQDHTVLLKALQTYYNQSKYLKNGSALEEMWRPQCHHPQCGWADVSSVRRVMLRGQQELPGSSM